MNNEIKALVIDVNGDVYVKKIKTELETYYEIIDCECIDITHIVIDGKHEYDVICDDEGLLKEDNKIAIFDTNNSRQIVGNCIICKNTPDGREASLKDSDIVRLCKHVMRKVITGLDHEVLIAD